MTAVMTLTTPAHRLLGDACLGCFGLAMGLLILSQTTVVTIWSLVALLITAAGAWFLLRTWRLQKTTITLSKSQLTWNSTPLRPSEVVTVKLRFFTGVRAARSGKGEFQLWITTAAGQTLFTDHRLEGFEKLAAWLADHYAAQPFQTDKKTNSALSRLDIKLTQTTDSP